MSHSSHNQRNIETERIGHHDDDTDEFPATDKIGSTTAIVRSIRLLKNPVAIWFSVGALIGGGTMWPMASHQVAASVSDDIPVMKSQIESIRADVATIKNILLQKALGP